MTRDHIVDLVGTMLYPARQEAPADLRRRTLTALGSPERSGFAVQRYVSRLAFISVAAVAIALTLFAVSTISMDGKQPAATAEAADILHRAAVTAQREAGVAPRPDQFIFVEQKTWAPSNPRSGAASNTITLTRSWLSVDGTRDGLMWTDTPRPEGHNPTPIPGCRNGRAPVWEADGTLSTNEYRACQPVPAYRTDLPTNADDMLAYLYKTGSGSGDQQAFGAVVALLQDANLPPAARASLFSAAARIPGVTVVHNVTDATGRTGTAVTRSDQSVRLELTFAPDTGVFLGWQIRPNGAAPTGPLRSAAVLRVVTVDQAGLVP